jgi:hypothetical protein
MMGHLVRSRLTGQCQNWEELWDTQAGVCRDLENGLVWKPHTLVLEGLKREKQFFFFQGPKKKVARYDSIGYTVAGGRDRRYFWSSLPTQDIAPSVWKMTLTSQMLLCCGWPWSHPEGNGHSASNQAKICVRLYVCVHVYVFETVLILFIACSAHSRCWGRICWLNLLNEPGVVVYACNPSVWEVESVGSEFGSSLGYIARSVSKNNIEWVWKQSAKNCIKLVVVMVTIIIIKYWLSYF